MTIFFEYFGVGSLIKIDENMTGEIHKCIHSNRINAKRFAIDRQ